MTKKQDIQTENRLTKLEESYISLSSQITEIKDNHLAHLSNDVKELGKKVDSNNTARSNDIQEIKMIMAKWGGIVVGASAIIQIVISFLK